MRFRADSRFISRSQSHRAFREDTPFKPAFVVKNLDEVRVAAAATGGSLGPSSEAWRYNGYLVLDGCDPEGNVVQFRQHDA